MMLQLLVAVGIVGGVLSALVVLFLFAFFLPEILFTHGSPHD